MTLKKPQMNLLAAAWLLLLVSLVVLACGIFLAATDPAAGEDMIAAPAPLVTVHQFWELPPGQDLVVTGPVAPESATAPTDPFRATAVHALRGDYGKLQPWQAAAYQSGLTRGIAVKPGLVWITHYWPAEGRDGQVDCRGNRCTARTAACNELPYGTVIWLEEPCGLRTVLDRGAGRNDRVARRYGADFWVDRWNPGPRDNYLSRYAVIDNAGGS